MNTLPGRREVVDPVPAHLQRQERDDQNPVERPRGVFAEQTQVDIEQVTRPRGRGPGLLRVPAPVVAPSRLGPDRTGEHADGQKGQSGVDQLVGRFEVVGPTFDESHAAQNEGAPQHRIGEHVDGDMRDEPRALQGGHQRLVVDFGFQNVDEGEDRRHHRREAEDSGVAPPQVGHQSGYAHEEGVPQPGLSHGAQRRTLHVEPEPCNECREDQRAHAGQQNGPAASFPAEQRHPCAGCPQHDGDQREPIEIIPREHHTRTLLQYVFRHRDVSQSSLFCLFGPARNSRQPPHSIMITPSHMTYFSGSRTICTTQ